VLYLLPPRVASVKALQNGNPRYKPKLFLFESAWGKPLHGARRSALPTVSIEFISTNWKPTQCNLDKERLPSAAPLPPDKRTAALPLAGSELPAWLLCKLLFFRATALRKTKT